MEIQTRRLQRLESIVENPNLNGGVWESFKNFIIISDKILEEKDSFSISDRIVGELESIRKNFEKTFGFKLECSRTFWNQIQQQKEIKSTAHKFKAKLSKFMYGYKCCFIQKS